MVPSEPGSSCKVRVRAGARAGVAVAESAVAAGMVEALGDASLTIVSATSRTSAAAPALASSTTAPGAAAAPDDCPMSLDGSTGPASVASGRAPASVLVAPSLPPVTAAEGAVAGMASSVATGGSEAWIATCGTGACDTGLTAAGLTLADPAAIGPTAMGDAAGTPGLVSASIRTWVAPVLVARTDVAWAVIALAGIA